MKNNKLLLPVFATAFFLSNVSIETFTMLDNDLQKGDLSIYEVRLTYTGYILYHGKLEECPINPSGKVTLIGLLKGDENIPADDDVSYSGNLQLDINIDACSAKRNPGSSEDFLCGMTIKGLGLVKTELEIDPDGRGGYVQTRDTTSSGFTKQVYGTCSLEEMNEERDMIPLETKANVFNGLELPMLTQRTLRVGRYVQRDETGELVVEVLRKVQ